LSLPPARMAAPAEDLVRRPLEPVALEA